MTVADLRIPVQRRPNGLFAGDIPVTFWAKAADHYKIPPLSTGTLNRLGHPYGYHLRLRECLFCRLRCT